MRATKWLVCSCLAVACLTVLQDAGLRGGSLVYGDRTSGPPLTQPTGVSGSGILAGGKIGRPAFDNSVVVESKAVPPNAVGVQVGVYFSNDVPLQAIVMPLEFRSLTPGSYISGSFARGFNTAGRIWNSALGGNNPNGPEANITLHRYAFESGTCSNTLGHTYQVPTANVDFISPDGTMLATVSYGEPGQGEESELLPGADPSGVPSFVFTFNVTGINGSFLIDSCCVTPANHLEFVHNYTGFIPSFTPGVITIGIPADCASHSTTDRYLLTCPKGDSPFKLKLLDGAGNPVVGDNSAYLDFSACSSNELRPVPGAHPYWPTVYATAPSDAAGEVTFNVFAGGDCADCDVTINTGCGFSAVVPVHSLDVNGDLCVSGVDHHSSEGMCRDYNADFVVNAKDFGLNIAHLDHCAPLGACDNLALQLSISPQHALQLGDSVRVDWTVSYTEDVGSCGIDSVVLRHFDCESASSLHWVGADDVGENVYPAAPLSGQIAYVNPDALDFCIQARVYSDCCDSFAVTIVRVTTQKLCPLDTCFAFYTSELNVIDHYFVPEELLSEGWSYDVSTVNLPEFGPVTQTLICTGPSPVEGTSAYVVIDHNGYGSPMAYHVTVKASEGDVCGKFMDCGGIPARRVPDCVLSVLDVVCMIDYIFRNVQPSPCPIENMDLNCDCIYDIRDIVTEVGTIFRNQPLPDECDVICP